MDFSAIRTKMQSVCRGQSLQGQDAAAVLEVAEICVHTCLCIGTYISILMTLLFLRGRLLRKAGPGAFHMGLMFLRNTVTVSFKCQCDCDVCFWIPTCHSWESREWWMSQKAWFFHGFCLQGPALISCPDFFSVMNFGHGRLSQINHFLSLLATTGQSASHSNRYEGRIPML